MLTGDSSSMSFRVLRMKLEGLKKKEPMILFNQTLIQSTYYVCGIMLSKHFIHLFM